uniref:Endosomal SPRY domain protein n=1 Tax=Volvariella volvacea TaxID=36659 RepID=V5M3G2_9AGAR|nr:endosomal SPRY domain protein [Volvariella volvacea]
MNPHDVPSDSLPEPLISGRFWPIADILSNGFFDSPSATHDPPGPPSAPQQPDALLVLLPLLIVLSVFLFLLLLFLICVILIRRRRGIVLRDNDGPIDMSREELIEGEGGFEGVETRWLESVSEPVRRDYLRAKEHQLQYPPNSLPTDITLSQFLSIQEKGVSAWSFEPDYETVNSLLVHARTEITFLPDPASSSCVQSNLPLPKINEVYYWEVKMFDLPETTKVAVGLATKPYPAFCMPGLSRYSVAYHSNGDKSYNYPFTATSFGPPLKEGDVLGIGYRPRTGTVFFTRNGRKLEDAFVGLSKWNLFPTIGADGPCSVHVNLGQAGFVFIEANVKKWGLAPSVGTLAPPPAYGSEGGSILLDVGGRVRLNDEHSQGGNASPPSHRRSHRARRPRASNTSGLPTTTTDAAPPLTPPPPITPILEAPEGQLNAQEPGIIAESGHAIERHPPNASIPSSPAATSRSFSPDRQGIDSELIIQVHPPPDSPRSPNPPTPNNRDIHLQALGPSTHRSNNGDRVDSSLVDDRLREALTRREPPAYSPLDAFTYSEGVHIDLPAEVIAAALEGTAIPDHAVGRGNASSRSERRRTRRR